MKLNLGCGSNLMPGFLNVDKITPPEMRGLLRDEAEARGFLQWDLEAPAWPWRDNSVDEICMIHSMEHMGQTPEEFERLICQLYRVCAHNAKIIIHVPHPRHDDFLSDPTHVRPILPETFTLFSKRLNDKWREEKASNSQLAYAWGVNFEIEDSKGVLDGGIECPDPEQRAQIIRGLNNVVKEFQITLRVIKEMVH